MKQSVRNIAPLYLIAALLGTTGPSEAGVARPPSRTSAPREYPAAPLTQGTVRTVLPNGVTLLVRPSRHAPVAAVVTHVKAGYFDEPDRVAGMAHLFEHMFFKGSRKYPGPQAIAEAVRRLG